jgi:hypothetical protein
MSETIQSVLYILAAGVILILGVVILRGVLKVAWKFVRVILILLALLLIAGYFLGFLDIAIR